MPDEQLAVVVLANRQDAEMSQALMLEALTFYLGANAKDHVREALAERVPAAGRMQAKASSNPPLPLNVYTGQFQDPLLGSLTITLEDGHLVLRRARWIGTLSHLDGQRFEAIWNDPFFAALGTMTITLELKGGRPSAVSAFGGRFKRLGT